MNDDKFAQIPSESISTWAESIGLVDLSSEILDAVKSDSTFRLHQVLRVCRKYLSHSNRRKLTSEDFNRALALMDVPPIYGYSGSEASEWASIPDLNIFVAHDSPVNLASTALSGDIFHQPGNTYVRGKWKHLSGHMIMKDEVLSDETLSPLPLSPPLAQYYQTLFSAITNPSVYLFQKMCDDVGSSPNIGPLVGYILRSVLKGAQKASQKPLVLRRLLRVVRSLIFNPHVHLGPQNYIHDIVNVLVFSVVTERKNSQDTQLIRNLAANILLKLCRQEGFRGSAWELAVISLSGVVASSTRPWTQHAGALSGLIPLGVDALYRAIVPIASEYYARLSHTLSHSPYSALTSAILAKDILDANMTSGLLLMSLVKMVSSLVSSLPDSARIIVSKKEEDCPHTCSSDESSKRFTLLQKIKEVYFLGEEMFGSAFVLQLPSLYLYFSNDSTAASLGSVLSSSSLYQDRPSENLFSDFNDPPSKRRKIFSSGRSVSAKSQNVKVMSPSASFTDYRLIIPVRNRKIFMCIRGCSTRKFEYLKQRSSSLPPVSAHPGRQLLVSRTREKSTGRMPHWTFIRPIRRRIDLCLMNCLLL